MSSCSRFSRLAWSFGDCYYQFSKLIEMFTFQNVDFECSLSITSKGPRYS